ncbi:hypothetical protein EDD18DRAFT_384600 [Armillaria luteobubalina]|uniref:Uncharacterized protein n=1 Tax=Armillaria luteobubalina TaxID=153913 RepID=A0AA39UV40_9AGAR|nr:hypothetical protein EDD18DRAFT_384600 [Armillaria luteobubalina]
MTLAPPCGTVATYALLMSFIVLIIVARGSSIALILVLGQLKTIKVRVLANASLRVSILRSVNAYTASTRPTTIIRFDDDDNAEPTIAHLIELSGAVQEWDWTHTCLKLVSLDPSNVRYLGSG